MKLKSVDLKSRFVPAGRLTAATLCFALLSGCATTQHSTAELGQVSTPASVPGAASASTGTTASADRPVPSPAPAATVAAAPAVSAQTNPTPATAEPASPASLTPAALEKARELFADYSCNACHTLADAGAAGAIGPSLDRNPNLTVEFAIDRISHGAGAMPGYLGQMSEAEIAELARYVVAVSRK